MTLLPRNTAWEKEPHTESRALCHGDSWLPSLCFCVCPAEWACVKMCVLFWVEGCEKALWSFDRGKWKMSKCNSRFDLGTENTVLNSNYHLPFLSNYYYFFGIVLFWQGKLLECVFSTLCSLFLIYEYLPHHIVTPGFQSSRLFTVSIQAPLHSWTDTVKKVGCEISRK